MYPSSRKGTDVAQQGSVYQRTDGYWTASIRVGSKKIVRYAKSERDASRKLQELLRLHHQGTLAQPTKLTLGDWVRQWLADLDVRPSTERTYDQVLTPVLRGVGHVRLDKLTPAILSLAYSMLARDGMGARRLQLSYGYLKSCLERAVDLEILGRNPLLKVRRPKWEWQPKTYWTVDEASRFVRTCAESDRRWAPLFAVLTTCGLRISEALGLTWADVDLQGRTLRVERALVWAGGTYRVGPVKTKAALRAVSLTDAAVEALNRLPRPINRDQGVFRSVHGNPPRVDQLHKPLAVLCADGGAPKINVHGLRHVAGTLAMRALKDAHSVQRRLGHSHVSITMAIYGYPTRSDSEVAHAVDGLLAGDSRGGLPAL